MSPTDVLTAIVALAGIVVAGSLLAAAPGAMNAAFRPPIDVGWPHGVQEDDDATWSWATAGDARDAGDAGHGSEAAASERGADRDGIAPLDVEPTDAGVELEPVRYAVRSPDRERS